MVSSRTLIGVVTSDVVVERREPGIQVPRGIGGIRVVVLALGDR